MKIAKKSTVKLNKIGASAEAWEYPLLSKQIHGVVIKVGKRYPDAGFSRNDVCTEIAYIISGSGKLVGRNKELEFSAGDELEIDPGEDFCWQGAMEIFMPCAPAWYPEQHKFSK